MKHIALQLLICLILAASSLAFELLNGSDCVSEFIRTNGLLTMSALFALNIASLSFVITRLLDLESKFSQDFRLDSSKLEALRSIKEQLWLLAAFFVLLICMREDFWKFKGIQEGWAAFYAQTDVWHGVRVLLVAIAARAAFFQMIYATYDSSRAIIISSVAPPSLEKKRTTP